MKYLSLFSGIGGLDLALDALGHEAVGQVEIDPFCLRVLERRWPDVQRVTDIRKLRISKAGGVDLIVGGFPCQPVSYAGRGLAQDDPRWLWPEFARIIGEARPELVFIENVPGLRTRGLDDVLADLERLGYGGAWDIVSAADVGAWHLRKRLWILAERGRAGGFATRTDAKKTTPSRRFPTPGAQDAKWRATPAVSAHRLATGRTISLEDAVVLGPKWPTPTGAPSRPNEGNVRLLRARVLAGDMTEAEAAAMLNGKSVFEAQGKLPALNRPLPTPQARDHFPPHSQEYIDARRANGYSGMSNLNDAVSTEPDRYFPTVRSSDGERGGRGDLIQAVRGNENQHFRFPTAHGISGGHADGPYDGHGSELRQAASTFPSPASRDWKDAGPNVNFAKVAAKSKLAGVVALDAATTGEGPLNPTWVEWLMGFPIGWTDLTADEGDLIPWGWESEPGLPRLAKGIERRKDRLMALGNAVVPESAIAAFEWLHERLRRLDHPA